MAGMRTLFLLALVSAAFSLHAKPYIVSSVPNPRSQDGGFVSDPDGILLAADRAELNGILRQIEQDTTAEYAVVILESIGTQIPKSFAVDLFNTWGIGKSGKDNGLLLLVVLDQRRWEFETGYGLEGVLPDVVLSRLARDTFPDYFRKKQYGLAIIDVSRQIESILKHAAEEIGLSPEQRAEQLAREEEKLFAEYIQKTQTSRMWFGLGAFAFLCVYCAVALFVRNNRKRPPSGQRGTAADKLILAPLSLWFWLPAVLIWPFMLVVVAYWNFYTIAFIYQVSSFADSYLGYILGAVSYCMIGLMLIVQRQRRTTLLLKENPDPGESYRLIQEYLKDAVPGLVFFPLFYGPYWIASKLRLGLLRRTPRKCLACNNVMRRLGESEEDPKLEPGQLLEETLGSVDYDVWMCPQDSEIKIEKYVLSSPYSECEACKFVTSVVIRNWTIQSPTYESAGQGGEEQACRHCGRKKETRYVIAKLVRSGSASGGSYSSGGSSSRSSGSSSGGSFGGGRSGGGGAGGSW
ncbi:MAG TPA: TPM domain-containing protein [Leptospiraceae bacterium]|nr:TPM domain-containing protein [Leptospiraceae bacterium]